MTTFKLLPTHNLLLAFFGLLLISCSGWNSEIESKIFEDPVDTQAKCSFKIRENCWQRSLRLLGECMPSGSQPGLLLPPDRRLCRLDDGSVTFDQAVDFAGDFNSESISFRVYGPHQLCFRFSGTQQNFVISETGFGKLQVVTLNNGDRLVSCFDNQSFVIPAQVQKNGCAGEKASIDSFSPQAFLSHETLDSGATLSQFHLTGVPFAEGFSVFQCLETTLAVD